MEKAKENHGPICITTPSESLDLWCLPRYHKYNDKQFYFTFNLENFKKVITQHSELVLSGGVPVCVRIVISRAFRPDTPSFKMEVTAIPESNDERSPAYIFGLDVNICHSEMNWQSVAKTTNSYTLNQDNLAEIPELKVQVKLSFIE